jgi:hypothetical protein
MKPKVKGKLLLAKDAIPQRFGRVARERKIALRVKGQSGIAGRNRRRHFVRRVGGDIKIAALPDPMQTLFELKRLNRVFAIFYDRVATLASF